MIWNQWQRSRPTTGTELLAAAVAIIDHLPDGSVTAVLGDRALTWSVRKGALRDVAQGLAQDDLRDEWEEEIDDVDADGYEIVLDFELGEADSVVLTWNPKAGDNNAAWPVAWLLVTRFTGAIGAEQVTVSAGYLLEKPAITSPLVTLPLIAMRANSVLPTGRAFPTTIGRRASISSLDAAIAHHEGWCIVGVQLDPATEMPSATDLHPIACAAKISKYVALSPENRFVVLIGAERVEVGQVDVLPDGTLMASGTAIDDEAPDERIPRLLFDAAEQLIELTIPSDNMADDALEILHRLPATRLADGAAEIFASMVDPARRVEALQELDPSERLMLMVDTLGATVTAIHDALDEHGDLEDARLAMVEAALAEARRSL